MRLQTRHSAGVERASVLIITLWVALGLVAMTLYFGQTTSLELSATDQRVAGIEADHAIDGAARYAAWVLTQTDTVGVLPDPVTYRREAVELGGSMFWFIGRDPQRASSANSGSSALRPYFGLIDESSKLNINTATAEMLQLLPNMTPELAAAIIDWRDTDVDVSGIGGAEDDMYLLRDPPSQCKNAPYETLRELRLVFGMRLLDLYGEDGNLNGILDDEENDGEVTLPWDDKDGSLEMGLFEFVTPYSRIPNTTSNGTQRINITRNGFAQQLSPTLQELLGTERANEILRNFNGNNATARSFVEFYTRSGMTLDEFVQIEDMLTLGTGEYMEGLVNVNTASEAVLACIPGIGVEKAPQLIAYRQSNPNSRRTVAWVSEVLDNSSLGQAGRYLTGRSYQYTADIAAVGRNGRGYRRARVLIDTSASTPRITLREDLSNLGWALGRETRQRLPELTARLNATSTLNFR